MKGLLYSILVSIFTLCFFLNEFKWKKLNPNGFVKSDIEASHIIETSKRIENPKNKYSVAEKVEDYSFLEINITQQKKH